MAPSVARAQDTIRQDQPEPDQTGRAVLAAINIPLRGGAGGGKPEGLQEILGHFGRVVYKGRPAFLPVGGPKR